MMRGMQGSIERYARVYQKEMEKEENKIPQKVYEKNIMLLTRDFISWCPQLIRCGDLIYFYTGKRYAIFDKHEQKTKFYEFCKRSKNIS